MLYTVFYKKSPEEKLLKKSIELKPPILDLKEQLTEAVKKTGEEVILIAYVEENIATMATRT
jgi:hypothetical protein